MSSTRPAAPTSRRPRYTLNSVRDWDDNSLYVLNHSSKIMKKPTHLMLSHTSPDSGDTRPIEVPMTFIPIDLTEFAPKEELLRNSDLLRAIRSGLLELVPPDEAQKQLDAPHAVAEYDRLQSDRLRRLSVNPSTGDSTEDEALRRSLPPEMLPRNAPGQLDDSTEGVHPSVVEALAAKFDNETHRAALMRNLVPLMSDRDRQYVRSQTMDPEIRGLVG